MKKKEDSRYSVASASSDFFFLVQVRLENTVILIPLPTRGGLPLSYSTTDSLEKC